MLHAQTYFEELQKIDNQELSEHSLRTALENLLNSIRNDSPALQDVQILQEGKRIGKSGVPDFRITTSKGKRGLRRNQKNRRKFGGNGCFGTDTQISRTQ